MPIILRMTNNIEIQKHWDRWAKENPYYAVLTNSQYLASSLDENAKQTFLGSGRDHVEKVWNRLGLEAESTSSYKILDFGCGVGRVAIPLSKRCQSLDAVDISSAMLSLARSAAQDSGVANIEFKHLSAWLEDSDQGLYDLVHSALVFQHVASSEALKLCRQVLNRLKPGGKFFLHFAIGEGIGWTGKIKHLLLRHIFVFRYLANQRSGHPIDAPLMEMFSVDLNQLLLLFYEFQCSSFDMQLVDHGGVLTAEFAGERAP